MDKVIKVTPTTVVGEVLCNVLVTNMLAIV